MILSGKSSGIPDDATALAYAWAIKSISTTPGPETLGARASAKVHEDLNALLEAWTGEDLDSSDDPDDTDDNDGITQLGDILTGISAATDAAAGAGQFQYFTTPKLSAGLKFAQITFTLTVTYTDGDGAQTLPGSDITITVSDTFFSSYIDGPSYCYNKSLGGPTTQPHDGSGNGVADVCSLPYTRREAVARQNALQQLADLGLTVADGEGQSDFEELVMGRAEVDAVLASDGPDGQGGTADDVEAADAVAGTDGTCAQAKNLADEPDDADACDDDATGLTPPPAAIDPAVADLYYSGVITGPDFCTNRSLGGARTFAHDSDDPKDGVADVCSLGFTRREAVARQLALEKFTAHAQFNNALAAACTALGSESFGADADDLAKDACSVPPGTRPAGPGKPLPPGPSA